MTAAALRQAQDRRLAVRGDQHHRDHVRRWRLDANGDPTDAGFAASDVARSSVANTFNNAQTIGATSNQLVLGRAGQPSTRGH